MTSRPDILFKSKKLTTRYGRATKADFVQATRLATALKTQSTQYVIPDIGSLSEAVLLGICDASTRSVDTVFSTGAHVILLVNKHIMAASVIHYQSKDKTFQELWFIHSKTNVSDSMTKARAGGTGKDLLKILRSGFYKRFNYHRCPDMGPEGTLKTSTLSNQSSVPGDTPGHHGRVRDAPALPGDQSAPSNNPRPSPPPPFPCNSQLHLLCPSLHFLPRPPLLLMLVIYHEETKPSKYRELRLVTKLSSHWPRWPRQSSDTGTQLFTQTSPT